MSLKSVGTEFSTTNDNCCKSCCKPCRICLAPVTSKCGTDHLFFRLHGMSWRTAYGKPAGLFRCCSPAAFLGTRAVLAVFWLAVACWSLAADCPDTAETVWNSTGNATDADDDCVKWPSYLTHWTLLLELVYLSFAAYSTYMAIHDTNIPDGVGEATPWFISVTYALQPTVLIASLLVFLMYWALVFTPPLKSPLSVFTHGVNFFVMLFDLLLVRNPMYLSHVLMPMCYAVIYLIFSLIFYAATGESIYDALDWGNPSGAGKLSALILFVGLPFLWILMYCVFLGRRCHRVATSEDRAETV